MSARSPHNSSLRYGVGTRQQGRGRLPDHRFRRVVKERSCVIDACRLQRLRPRHPAGAHTGDREREQHPDQDRMLTRPARAEAHCGGGPGREVGSQRAYSGAGWVPPWHATHRAHARATADRSVRRMRDGST
ncbi:hypothetical protein ACFCWV_00710 [Streptomyces sp. NPDC056341]|uniref:hypothetical protein n=1 Tax=Streptomyces sp. NPDC056341 TaxID=3345788 RepID=UPI0035DE28D3